MKKSNYFNSYNKKRNLMFGIDLGTTNSVISYLSGIDSDVPKVLEENGKAIVPSCVWYKEDTDSWIVGREAYENRFELSALYSTKKFMGSGKKLSVTCPSGRVFQVEPKFVASLVLKELKRVAEITVGEGLVKDVVITVPAYFNDIQRQDTIDAGKMAGLNVLKIINEPTAASIVYNLDKQEENKNILVYDLGGGTFDITVFKFQSKLKDSDLEIFGLEEDNSDDKDTIEVLATNGDTHLGGDDIDNALYDLLCNKVERELKRKYQVKIKYRPNRIEKEKLLLQLENAKKNSNYNTLLKVKVTGYGEISVVIGKADIENAEEVIFQKTKKLLDETLKQEELKNIKVSQVVTVGGSTKSDYIKNRLQQLFPDAELFSGLDPDLSVSLGAANFSQVLTGTATYSVVDVNPIPIGIKTQGGRFSQLIRQNQILPYSVRQTLSTVEDNQKVAIFEIYQGKSNFCEDNIKLGDLKITDFKTGKAGIPQFNAYFKLDLNGVLSIDIEVDGKRYTKTLERGKDISKVKTGTEDIVMKRWRALAETDKQLKELLDNNEDKETIIAYLRDKKAKSLSANKVIKQAEEEIQKSKGSVDIDE